MSGSPTSHIQSLETLAGTNVLHFAKNNDFHKDLYHDFVAPVLKSNLFTETWQFGHKIGPSCSGSFTVLDVQDLSVDVPAGSFAFDVYNDHSKYVVTDDESSYYVCIGDINRQVGLFLSPLHLFVWSLHASCKYVQADNMFVNELEHSVQFLHWLYCWKEHFSSLRENIKEEYFIEINFQKFINFLVICYNIYSNKVGS